NLDRIMLAGIDPFYLISDLERLFPAFWVIRFDRELIVPIRRHAVLEFCFCCVELIVSYVSILLLLESYFYSHFGACLNWSVKLVLHLIGIRLLCPVFFEWLTVTAIRGC